MVEPGLHEGKEGGHRGKGRGEDVNKPIPRLPASLFQTGEQPVSFRVHQIKEAVDPSHRSEFQAVVPDLLHPKTAIPQQLDHAPKGSDPKMARGVQMEPLAAETFRLEGVQVHRGEGEESVVCKVLPAGTEKGKGIVQMFQHLPAGDRRGLFLS